MKIRNILLFVAVILLLVSCFVAPHLAHAQDFVTQTNANTMMFQAAAIASDTSTSKPKQTQAPVKLYRERVPGKPEEGFVPVTATATKRYQYTKVDYPYGEVLIFEDFVRRNVCYITINNGRISESCVPMK